MEVGSQVTACAGADFIFNGLNPVYTKWQSDLLPMTRNVIAAAIAAKAIHLFPGNVYNYGSTLPEVTTPDTPHQPDTKKGNVRFDAEKMFRKAATESNLQTICIRAGDFFGGKMPGSWFADVLTRRLHKGVFVYPGKTNIPHAWAYLPDLANAFVTVANHADEYENFKEFLFEGHTVTGNEIKQAMEHVTNKQLSLKGMPWWLIRILAPIIPMLREITEISYLWQRPHGLQDGELTKLIEGNYATPLDEAIRQSLIDLDRLPESATRQNLALA